jgi:hypothetical protein
MWTDHVVALFTSTSLPVSPEQQGGQIAGVYTGSVSSV